MIVGWYGNEPQPIKVKGKVRCVKKHKKKHRRRYGKHGPHAVASGR